MKNRLLLIYNPKAGKGQFLTQLPSVIDLFTKAGYAVEVYPTQAGGDCVRKIEAIANTAVKRGLQLEIEVDGGVKVNNAAEVAAAGATVLVAGTAVVQAPDPVQAVKELRACGA